MPHPTWNELEPRFRELLDRPLTATDVPAFLNDLDSVEREVREAFAALSRAKDEDTADQAAKDAFLAFVRDVQPKLAPIRDQLDRKLLAVEGYVPPPELQPVWDDLRQDVELFRDANVPLQVEEQTLRQRYGEIAGATRVELDGEEVTIAQARARLERPDRAEREAAWRAIEAGKAEQQPALDELFLEFALLRERIAHHADLPDYRAYAWKDRHRREYDVADAKAMHAAVEAEIVTRLRAHYARRRERMGVDTLRPWDLNADSSGADPLRPFETVAELESGLKRMFEALDPELGEAYGLLLDGWMDLEPRPNKVPGLGYQSYFPVSRRPYVYWSAVGTDGDLLTMRHEAGHAFHSVLTERSWPLLAHRSVRAEMNELAAESMELLTLPLLDDAKAGFYGAEDADRSRTKLLERVALLLVRACQVDAIQHWIYERPASELSAEAIDAAWLDLEARFDVGVDWSGLERERAKGWQIIHLFHFPFYYLEYAIAYLGALQLWERMDEDAADALAGYKRALALGGTRPMDQLYAAAGIEFRFDRELIARLGARWEAKLLEAWDSAGSGGRPG